MITLCSSSGRRGRRGDVGGRQEQIEWVSSSTSLQSSSMDSSANVRRWWCRWPPCDVIRRAWPVFIKLHGASHQSKECRDSQTPEELLLRGTTCDRTAEEVYFHKSSEDSGYCGDVSSCDTGGWISADVLLNWDFFSLRLFYFILKKICILVMDPKLHHQSVNLSLVFVGQLLMDRAQWQNLSWSLLSTLYKWIMFYNVAALSLRSGSARLHLINITIVSSLTPTRGDLRRRIRIHHGFNILDWT